MSGGGRSSEPDCPVDMTIPGWRDIVEPYKQDAVFWHGVWQSADRLSHGQLKNIMTRTRNQESKENGKYSKGQKSLAS
jgi:hypothetical protein